MPTGAETKNRTFVQQPPAQRSGLILPLPRYRTAAKDVPDPLEGFALRPGRDPEAAISQSWIRLLLFLGSLLCHLLGGCLRGLLSLLRFLGHVVLCKNTGSVNMRMPWIDMHNIETLSQMQN